MPLIAGDEVTGVISLQNLDREHAFTEADVRLLQTLANSMSVALENARLFAETQRLLNETQHRAAELAVINSVQEGLVAELDFQGIIDLVGDKLREVLHTARHRHPALRPDGQPGAVCLRVRARPAPGHRIHACPAAFPKP